MADDGCLSESGLRHLKTYKYSSVDNSPLSKYILRHYWNACVEFLPLWLAPNMVTLLGFMCVVGNVVLLEVMDAGLTGPGRAWVCYSYAAGVWAYSTLDNIDGKQARRTGTSSGLGELFDHGIDSLNCTLASLLAASAMGLRASRLAAFTALVPTLPMFFSTWETYHTHTLYLGYFNGPTEGLLIASLIMAASGWYGAAVWDAPLADLVGPALAAFAPPGCRSVKDAWAGVLLAGFFLAHLPGCVRNVVAARRAAGLPLAPAFLGWAPMLAFVGSLVAWLGSPDSRLLRDNHLCLLCVTLAFVFGRLTSAIVLAHLTRKPFPHWDPLLSPLVLGASLVNLPRLLGRAPVSAAVEHAYLATYCAVAAVVYFRWSYRVVNAICEYLDISCLTIPEEKWRALQRERRSVNGVAAAPLTKGKTRLG